MDVKIQELMETSGVKFGTSGARGLAVDMTDFVCYAYTQGFLQYLESQGAITSGQTRVAIAGDLRPSTERIMRAVARSISDRGYEAVNCGTIPSPAVALYGIQHQIPAIMVTGSHIPADRNGIKFNKPTGEILKDDEAGIRSQCVSLDEGLFIEGRDFAQDSLADWPIDPTARDAYVQRYVEAFAPDCLADFRIGVYEHSAVGRDLLVEIYQGLGAEVIPLCRSQSFVPVDTEAIRNEDIMLAQAWANEQSFDAIVSTDGDSDRPLIADENGQWLRGDIAGILCAQFLGADSVSTPVSCNTAVEKCGRFQEVRRTRIGSPYVIASMQEAVAAGSKVVVGYEANGGFLINSDIQLDDQVLKALPTRDAVIVHLGILLLSSQEGLSLAQLKESLPSRFTASDRLQNFPPAQSQAILTYFNSGDPEQDRIRIDETFGELSGTCHAIDTTDGIRITFANDEIIHLRPSGNAPEFRCYTEADTENRAQQLNQQCLEILAGSLQL